MSKNNDLVMGSHNKFKSKRNICRNRWLISFSREHLKASQQIKQILSNLEISLIRISSRTQDSIWKSIVRGTFKTKWRRICGGCFSKMIVVSLCQRKPKTGRDVAAKRKQSIIATTTVSIRHTARWKQSRLYHRCVFGKHLNGGDFWN